MNRSRQTPPQLRSIRPSIAHGEATSSNDPGISAPHEPSHAMLEGFTPDALLRLCRLARLRPPVSGLDALHASFDRLLATLNVLGEADISMEREEKSDRLPECPRRPDRVRPSLEVAAVLKAAPERLEQAFFLPRPAKKEEM